MGSRALVYYITTTGIAVILGIILVTSIHPGNPSIKSEKERMQMNDEKNAEKAQLTTLDAFIDLLKNLFPENLIQATLESGVTTYKKVTPMKMTNMTDMN